MKEMCRNFACNREYATQSNADAQASATAANTKDCNTCVTEQIGLAEAMVPLQAYAAPTEAEQSLICGTAFAALSMPYCTGWNLYRFGGEAEA